MTTKRQPQTARAHIGLLECPLRKGYIEFEYEAGDCISELKKHVLEAWGVAFSEKHAPPRRFPFGQGGTKEWVLLCEDVDGAYLPLGDDDEIPLDPPGGGKVEPETTEYYQGPSKWAESEWAESGDEAAIRRSTMSLPLLFAFDVDLAYRPRSSEHAAPIKRVKRKNLRTLLTVVRTDYSIPDKKYSVHLVALAIITGG